MTDNVSKILASFSRLGYDAQSRISQQKIHLALTHLNGKQFPLDITDELWGQLPTNNFREGVIQDLAKVIIRGQLILVEKIKRLEYKIDHQSAQLRLMPKNNNRQIDRYQEIASDIAQDKRDKEQYQQDLAYLTEPFNITINLYEVEKDQKHSITQDIPSRKIESEELKIVFWMTLIIFVNQVIGSYSKYQFPNILASLLVLSIFVFNFFDEQHIHFSMWVILVTIGLDFIWLIVWASGYWAVGVSEIATQGSLFLKFVVLETIANVLLKILSLILLLNFRELEEGSMYVVTPFPGIRLKLVVNRKNSFSQNKAEEFAI